MLVTTPFESPADSGRPCTTAGRKSQQSNSEGQQPTGIREPPPTDHEPSGVEGDRRRSHRPELRIGWWLYSHLYGQADRRTQPGAGGSRRDEQASGGHRRRPTGSLDLCKAGMGHGFGVQHGVAPHGLPGLA